MFTGIIEKRGNLVSRTETTEGVRLVLEAEPGAAFDGVAIGESIAVNGCCLTVVAVEGYRFSFDLLQETMARTNLKFLVPGGTVNLERAMRADTRLGGHFVTGHVDGTGPILRWEPAGKGDYVVEVGIRPEDKAYLIPKGSVSIDGISLTVGQVKPSSFTVWIIPHTRDVTNLVFRKPGDYVNLEFDMLAKYVAQIVEAKAAMVATGANAIQGATEAWVAPAA